MVNGTPKARYFTTLYCRDLRKVVGDPDVALLVRQIHYLIYESESDNGMQWNGHHWVWNSHAQWAHMMGYSDRRFRTVLSKAGDVVSTHYLRSAHKTLYRLNYEVLLRKFGTEGANVPGWLQRELPDESGILEQWDMFVYIDSEGALTNPVSAEAEHCPNPSVALPESGSGTDADRQSFNTKKTTKKTDREAHRPAEQVSQKPVSDGSLKLKPKKTDSVSVSVEASTEPESKKERLESEREALLAERTEVLDQQAKMKEELDEEAKTFIAMTLGEKSKIMADDRECFMELLRRTNPYTSKSTRLWDIAKELQKLDRDIDQAQYEIDMMARQREQDDQPSALIIPDWPGEYLSESDEDGSETFLDALIAIQTDELGHRDGPQRWHGWKKAISAYEGEHGPIDPSWADHIWHLSEGTRVGVHSQFKRFRDEWCQGFELTEYCPDLSEPQRMAGRY